MTAPMAKVEVFEDLPQLTRRAAEIFVESSNRAVAQRGRFTVVLSGGKTPEGLYRLLADAAEYRDRITWRASHFFWGDERCVPPDHPESNFKMAFSAMLSKLDLPPENIHRIRAELPGAEAARDYEDELRRFFSLGEARWPDFDLVFLVAGADKAVALEAVLEGKPNPEQFPAQAIQPRAGSLIWLVDRPAASRLRRSF